MPNWKKIVTSGSDATLNSLSVTNGITGSLLGTASYANQALTASYANNLGGFDSTHFVDITTQQTIDGQKTILQPVLLGEFGVTNGKIFFRGVDTGNKISAEATGYGDLTFTDQTGSVLATLYQDGLGFELLSGKFIGTASFADTASIALSASYAPSSTPFPYTGSAQITGSLAVTGSINSTTGFTGSLLGTASYANNTDLLDGINSDGFVRTSTNQIISGEKIFRDTTFFGNGSTNDGKVTFVESTAGLSASISIDSEANLNIQNAEDLILATIYQNGDGIELASGTFRGNLTGNADTATTSSFASTASFVNRLNQNLTLVGNQTITGSLTVTNDLIVLGSASFQSISQSTLNIGTNLITVNTFSPSARFGGLAIIDSGSSPLASSSFLYDSVQDEFVFVHKGDGTNVTSSHFLVGPETYNNLGNETYITNNALLKSQGNEHVTSSNITDTGALVRINSNTAITGSLTVSSSNATQLQVGSNLLFVSSSGRVGIGTTTPAYNLQILDATSGIPQQLDIKNSTANSRAAFSLTNDANNSLFMQLGGSNYAASTLRNVAAIASSGASIDSFWIATNWESATGGTVPIRFVAGGYNNSSSLTITPGNPGNVGIGTTTPNSRLDVNGNTTITGSFTVTTGSNIELQVLNTGVRLGNIITDAHTVTGSLGISGSLSITGSDANTLQVRGSGSGIASTVIQARNGAGTTAFTVRNDGKVVVGSNSGSTAPGALTVFQGGTSFSNGINFQTTANDGNQFGIGASSTSVIQMGFNAGFWSFSGARLGSSATSLDTNGYGTIATGLYGSGIDIQGTFTNPGASGFGVAGGRGGNAIVDSTTVTANSSVNNTAAQFATLYANRNMTISGSHNTIASIVLNSTFNQTQAISTGSIIGINHIPVITSAYNYRAFDFSNTTAYTPNAAVTNYVWSRISSNISASVNNQQIVGLDIVLSGSNSAFTGVTRSALRLSTQNSTDNALSVIGIASVAGTTRLSGSFNTAISGSTLTVIGSGSAQPIFTVQGSQGELFSVTDSLTGSLFSVNDISGLPIMEVFSDNTILMGDYQDPMMLTTKKIAQTNSGSFVVYSIPTASYDGVFIDYTIKSGSNARAGTIMSTWAGSSIEFTEVDTMDIGSTTAVGLTMILSGSNAVLTGSSSTGAWTIRTIIRTI
jgi:hypothetical protein